MTLVSQEISTVVLYLVRCMFGPEEIARMFLVRGRQYRRAFYAKQCSLHIQYLFDWAMHIHVLFELDGELEVYRVYPKFPPVFEETSKEEIEYVAGFGVKPLILVGVDPITMTTRVKRGKRYLPLIPRWEKFLEEFSIEYNDRSFNDKWFEIQFDTILNDIPRELQDRFEKLLPLPDVVRRYYYPHEPKVQWLAEDLCLKYTARDKSSTYVWAKLYVDTTNLRNMYNIISVVLSGFKTNEKITLGSPKFSRIIQKIRQAIEDKLRREYNAPIKTSVQVIRERLGEVIIYAEHPGEVTAEIEIEIGYKTPETKENEIILHPILTRIDYEW